MYQQLYVYAGPTRKAFSYVSDVEAIDKFPEDCYVGSVWTIQQPDQALPGRFVVVDIPIIWQTKRSNQDRVPRIEIFLAPIQDQWLYGPPEFPFLRAA
ncbi:MULTISPECIES: hypothetical protein [Larkinella]|uniref:Uncharacterized protein n=1 Tax=Larkinella humicola TaxID=2607654 RepID=A0A5N1JMT4_9BACT|nr:MULTISPECIES: hypothetical protein [Larkinella]KAA9356886.1 hypothetical protein F0P93_03860 [Larkinella humicola]